MKKKIEAVLSKTSDRSKEERKKQTKPAAKLSKGTLTESGKKVHLVELTGGEQKLSHDDFCKMVYKSTFKYKEGENRCRVGISDGGNNLKIYELTGEDMDSVYDTVVRTDKQGKK